MQTHAPAPTEQSPPTGSAVTPPSFGRFGGLDGLRALAVGMVLIYHLFPAALPGGFIGVDMFFVISGFLITSLLMREQRVHHRISLRKFWQRRARRLLPALGLVLLVCSSLSLWVGGDTQLGLGRQLLGASTFSSNWIFIVDGADYFAHDTPELFRNVWSLAIEEQFYLILPLLFLGLLKLRGTLVRSVILAAIALGSATLMWALSAQGVDTTRVYFGTDTHGFGLLIGSALALALPLFPQRPSAARNLLQSLAGVLALAVLAVLALSLQEGSADSFQGGFQIATLAALLVVWSATRPNSSLGRALDAPLLTWVGARSYGIYLWHWPLLILAQGATRGVSLSGWQQILLSAGVLVVTIVVATLSHRFLEEPIRHRGLRNSLQALVTLARGTRRQSAIGSALLALLALTIPVTAIAVLTAPEESTAETAISRGAGSLQSEDPTAERFTYTDSHILAHPLATSHPPFLPAEEDRGDSASLYQQGAQISAVGDSVMLAASPELQAAFPGISLDAEVSRSFGAGLGILEQQSAAHELRSILVVGLGTNGPVAPEQLAELAEVAASRPIVLVNAHADREWIPGVNTALDSFATTHRGVVVADWNTSAMAHPEQLAGDGIHPEPAGGLAYAQSVQHALAALATPEEARGLERPRR